MTGTRKSEPRGNLLQHLSRFRCWSDGRVVEQLIVSVWAGPFEDSEVTSYVTSFARRVVDWRLMETTMGLCLLTDVFVPDVSVDISPTRLVTWWGSPT